MFESRSFVKSGIIFLSIALVVNGMFSLALFSTMQTRTDHSIGPPDYDSGWVSIPIAPQTLTLTHNLGTTEVFVYLIGNDSHPYGIHQWSGAGWCNLTDTTIDVRRWAEDRYLQGRVMIWKIEAGAVGGLYIPVDKFSLLAPYIALVSTIVLAVSASVAYIKYRKKR